MGKALYFIAFNGIFFLLLNVGHYILILHRTLQITQSVPEREFYKGMNIKRWELFGDFLEAGYFTNSTRE